MWESDIESNDTGFGRGAWVCGGKTWQARARVSMSEVVGNRGKAYLGGEVRARVRCVAKY